MARTSADESVADMANTKVQVYGDVAILTYNYIGSGLTADGDVKCPKCSITVLADDLLGG